MQLRAIETTTAEGRAQERYRRVALTTLASLGVRSIMIITSFVTVPLTLGYLGPERYGLWMTISSAITLLGFADFGMGNGLLNAISAAHGRDAREEAARAVSSTFLMLSAVAVVIASCFAIAYPKVHWAQVFNVTSAQAVAEAGPTICVLVACFIIDLPLGIVERIQRGYQEGFTSSLWLGFGNLMGLIGVLIAIRLQGGLPWLVLAMAGTPSLAMFINGVVLFGCKRPWLRPTLRLAHFVTAYQLLRTGFMFLILQVAVVLTFSTDNIIIARVLGIEAVTNYSVPAKLFGIVHILLNMMLLPLWPAYTEAIMRGDTAWVRKTFLQSLIMTIAGSSAVSAMCVFLGPTIIRIWVGPDAVPSFPLLVAIGCWTVMYAGASAVAMLLNAANALLVQVVSTIFLSSAAIVARIAFAKLVGLPGIPVGMLVAYTVFAALPFAFYIPSLLSNLEKRAAKGV